MIHLIETKRLPPVEKWRRFLLSDSQGFYGRYERWSEGFMKVVGRVEEWPSKPCQYEGCTETDTIGCYLPDTDWNTQPPDEWYCLNHAFLSGFCKGCGSFWGGCEDFDFGNGYCEHCQSEFEDDWDDDDYGSYWDGDDWEEYDEEEGTYY